MILKHLVYLDALARERHFRRAAEACNVSQPTLSAALTQLETELGVMIVERDRQFKGLTHEGELVLAHARRILAGAEVLRQSVAEGRQGVSGRLRLGAIPTALPMIAEVTGPYCERFPNVSLTVLSLNSHEIERRIAEFELDAGITYLDNEPLENVIVNPIYQESYVLLVRDDDPGLTSQTEIAWIEAAPLKLCLLTPDMQNRRIIDGIFRSVGQVPVPVIETNSIFNLCTHARLPGIASVVPRQLLEFFGTPIGTRALPLVRPEARRTIGLIVADRTPLPPIARNLMDMTRPVTAIEPVRA
ncbi:MAG: LysR family transcriptional regulator [Ancalomicrobiaceae bacterium]|nr:LysR family transcriptional regulator [Ancalomicrobiaceae bacterium]